MPIGDLLELIVCTDCKTRVEYHEERDGYMSCECWVRSMADDPISHRVGGKDDSDGSRSDGHGVPLGIQH